MEAFIWCIHPSIREWLIIALSLETSAVCGSYLLFGTYYEISKGIETAGCLSTFPSTTVGIRCYLSLKSFLVVPTCSLSFAAKSCLVTEWDGSEVPRPNPVFVTSLKLLIEKVVVEFAVIIGSNNAQLFLTGRRSNILSSIRLGGNVILLSFQWCGGTQRSTFSGLTRYFAYRMLHQALVQLAAYSWLDPVCSLYHF